MANISAKDVAELRKQTGCGMMDCKNALVEANGNFEEATKILREKGMATAAKKQSRVAADGVVDIMTIGNTTAMVEINSETDFAAKSDAFKEFTKKILEVIINEKPSDIADLMTKSYDGDKTVELALTELSGAVIREKISIRRFVVVDGIVSTYIHGAGATGVVISFNADDAVAANADFAEVTKNVALQAAAMPCMYLDKASVPASVVEEEKAVLKAQMANDPKMANKPEKVLEGIVTGKLGKFYETNCLMEQAYVKDDSMSVAKYVAGAAKAMGGNITVTGFYRYDKGEGIEKKEENFADEIAKMVNN